MDFKLNAWVKNKRFMLFFKSERFTKKAGTAKASIMAVVLGVLLGIIIVCVYGYNGFNFFGKIFSSAFDTSFKVGSKTMLDQTMLYFSTYFLIGLGLSLGFKIGLFNMGGSGQAVLGMGFAMHLLFTGDKSFSAEYAIVVILIFALSGVLISTLAGLLKALLNVHEVVTSIMLNWIVWYFIKWYDKDIMTSTGSTGTPDITQAEGHNYADWFNLASNPITIGLIFVVAAIVITWIVMTFTTVGYKFKVVGNQQDAAKYAGIQAKLYIILTMAVQGLLIGLGSFIYYVQIKGKLEIASDTIPTIGFDALTIPLVAFNNVFGMIPIALLWATIQSGMDIATVSEQGLQREVGSLMYGFIIYGAAIYILFLKFKPWLWIKTWIATRWDINIKNQIKQAKEDIKIVKIQRRFVKYSPELVALSTKMAALKGKKEAEYDYLRAKKEYKIELRSKMMTFKNEISQYKNEIKVLHGKALANFGIFWTGTHASAYKNKNRFELFEVLDGITREKVNRQVHMDREVQQRAGEISELKQKLHNAKQDNDVEMAGVFQDQINEINSIIKQKHAHIDEQFDKIFQDMISVYEQQARARKDEYLQKRTALKNDLRAIRDKVKQDAVAASAENKSLLTAAKATNNEINQRYKTQIADAKKGQADNMSEQIWKLQLDWVKERQANSFKFEKTSLYKVLDYKYQEEMGVADRYGRY
jgi:ABC-type uncharacterized transport system permease subunit